MGEPMMQNVRCALLAATVAALAAGIARPAAAQRVGLEVLGDVEFWKTDAGSFLLKRNDGRAVGLARITSWLIVRPSSKTEIFVLGDLMRGTGTGDSLDGSLEQASIKYTATRSFAVEAGKLLMPVGAFSARRFSYLNPLIGSPDTYGTTYPLGAEVSGAIGTFDYRAAIVDLPSVNERYVPRPGRALRPAAAVGVTLGPGLRLGASATRGPYLRSDLAAALPAGAGWESYKETVVGLEGRYTGGYLEARAEVIWSSYQVPTFPDAVDGLGAYAELRLTASPRVFVATRLERNRYAFVSPAGGTAWRGSSRTVYNGELGAGYRLTPDFLLKTSIRLDQWPGPSPPTFPLPDGYAFAVQLSYRADLLGMFAKKY
ncbi:MAG: hypothetical protein ABI647_01395 [Gemmatimonadota bacterium]